MVCALDKKRCLKLLEWLAGERCIRLRWTYAESISWFSLPGQRLHVFFNLWATNWMLSKYEDKYKKEYILEELDRLGFFECQFEDPELQEVLERCNPKSKQLKEKYESLFV